MDVTSERLPNCDEIQFTATEMRDGNLFKSQLIVPAWQLKQYSKGYTNEIICHQLFNALKEVTAEELQQRRDYIKSVLVDAMEGM